ncbi:hypothetical protein SAMN02745181_0439 [Rubritalea squalenifaciens DSM 18772]|uniref:Uncharacterized protein n=2 Tax=Rubritalea TaxID=361050 RepID=A0A1M6CBJ8_9BACT|nr:hypothetical protein [Rubritalea squalenifaciens]SHI58376.1 hypothetical protein SAMN02745181_0439 [Rubritalea squalenifaciens DSM 18772]
MLALKNSISIAMLLTLIGITQVQSEDKSGKATQTNDQQALLQLQIKIEKNDNGEVTSVYSYYLKDGKEVLHGVKYTFKKVIKHNLEVESERRDYYIHGEYRGFQTSDKKTIGH